MVLKYTMPAYRQYPSTHKPTHIKIPLIKAAPEPLLSMICLLFKTCSLNIMKRTFAFAVKKNNKRNAAHRRFSRAC